MQAHIATLRAAKALALTGLEILINKEALAEAKKEFRDMIAEQNM